MATESTYTVTELCRAKAKRHHLKSFLTISEYAARKNISRTAVLTAIQAGTIQAIRVGESEILYIDWDTHCNTIFSPRTSYKK